MKTYEDAVARFARLSMEGMVGVEPLPTAAERSAKSGAHVVAGHLAHDVGDALEKWLTAQHKTAAFLGLGHVRKVGAPVHVGKGGAPKAWAGRGPADYQGVVTGGRALALEAKSVGERLSRREIPQHQQDDLAAVERLGGLALLAVEIREAQLIAVVPWTQVPWASKARTLDRGKPSERIERSETIGAEELAPWRAVVGCYLRRWA